MKKIFKFDGVDCASCCDKLERKLSKIKGVNDVTLNFMTQKMIIDYENENTFEEVKDTLAHFEEGVSICRIG